MSCPGEEDVGCLPFKIQGRAADVPGNDSNMYMYNISFLFSGRCGSLIAHVHSVCMYFVYQSSVS